MLQGSRLRAPVRVLFATTLLAMLAGSPAAAGWRPIGPEGGDVLAFAFDPTVPGTVYAGTRYAGVFKSTNHGVSWAPTGTALEGFTVTALAVAGTKPSTVYAGTESGLFKSTNGGARWVPLTLGLPSSTPIVSLTVGAGASPAVYVLLQVPSQAYRSKVFESADGGATWREVGQALAAVGVVSLAADPAVPGRVYAGTPHGPWRSTDAGVTWSPPGHFDDVDDEVLAFAFSPSAAGHAYGTLYIATVSQVILASADGGDTWQVAARLNAPIIALVADPFASGILYMAVYSGDGHESPVPQYQVWKSSDGGVHWEAAGAGIPPARTSVLAVDPWGGATLLVNLSLGPGTWGIARSADHAATWTVSNRGLRAAPVDQVVADRRRPGALYALLRQLGLYKTLDGGSTWSLILPSSSMGPLELDAHRTATIYSPLDYHFSRSLDGGRTWRAIDPGLGEPGGVQAFTIDPTSDALYALTFTGMFRSTDGGASWSRLASYALHEVSSLAVAPNGTLYLTRESADIRGVFKSTDGARTWIPVLPATPSQAIFFQVTVDRVSSTVYVATERGVERSSDQGASWELAELPRRPGQPNAPTVVLAIMPDPRFLGTVYAATVTYGVHRSTDGGASWSPLGPKTASFVTSLALDPASPATVYAAGYSGLLRFDP
ncbi:MAG TPA: hypothetical protein VOA87_02730 [Thermoanaerobaculia bacterium]|nr:hypothetical protein [Thermoanaerobaculia bacterium]